MCQRGSRRADGASCQFDAWPASRPWHKCRDNHRSGTGCGVLREYTPDREALVVGVGEYTEHCEQPVSVPGVFRVRLALQGRGPSRGQGASNTAHGPV